MKLELNKYSTDIFSFFSLVRSACVAPVQRIFSITPSDGHWKAIFPVCWMALLSIWKMSVTISWVCHRQFPLHFPIQKHAASGVSVTDNRLHKHSTRLITCSASEPTSRFSSYVFGSPSSTREFSTTKCCMFSIHCKVKWKIKSVLVSMPLAENAWKVEIRCQFKYSVSVFRYIRCQRWAIRFGASFISKCSAFATAARFSTAAVILSTVCRMFAEPNSHAPSV